MRTVHLGNPVLCGYTPLGYPHSTMLPIELYDRGYNLVTNEAEYCARCVDLLVLRKLARITL